MDRGKKGKNSGSSLSRTPTKFSPNKKQNTGSPSKQTSRQTIHCLPLFQAKGVNKSSGEIPDERVAVGLALFNAYAIKDEIKNKFPRASLIYFDGNCFTILLINL